MSYLAQLHEDIKNKKSFHSTVNIIAIVEECPSSLFPVWYKYEGSEYEKESQVYKDKPVIEKGWVLYENLFCNLGKTLKTYIKSESDFTQNEYLIKNEEAPYAKYIPSMDEIREFTGPDFISLEYFIKMYVEMIDVELDEDIIWPYQWPINI